MTPPRSEGFVRIPDAEFEAILTRAAEEGAKRALADVGLDGDDPARVQLRVRAVVVAPDLVEPDGRGDSGQLVQIAQIGPEVLVVDDPAQAALEVDRVDGVEADQGREQPPIALERFGTE